MSDPRRARLGLGIAGLTGIAIAVLCLLGLCQIPRAKAEAVSPCSTRYPAALSFPPLTHEGAPLTIAALRKLAGHPNWGIAENVTLVSPKDAPGPLVLAVRLPEGSINPNNQHAPLGGMGLRWRPIVPGATSACLAYHLYLPADFAFNKGGKLPGLFGGNAPAGGKDVDGNSGFSARLMWRTSGRGEVYAYIPGKPDRRGQSIDRGAWIFPRGRWIRIEQEIVLNAAGKADGILRVWIDGELRLARADVTFRAAPSLMINGVMADIFYGGQTPEWAAPKDTAVLLSPFELGWR